MKQSFQAGGFEEPACRYRVFDNSVSNLWDPYGAINLVLDEVEQSDPADRPEWIIFCHQDLVLDQGHDIGDLMVALHELDETDPTWALAGNAGMTDRMTMISHISCPNYSNFPVQQPCSVVTLDENLLIVKPRPGLRCSADMSGFHLYGTDLCLNALRRGHGSYVINFRLTHNSMGTVDERFYQVLRKLQDVWRSRFFGLFVGTTVTTFALSRFKLLHRIMNNGRATMYAVGHPALCSFLLRINRSLMKAKE